MKKGHIHARSWDNAVQAIRAELLALPANIPTTDEGRKTLAVVDALCAELTARKYLAWFATNAELAEKYAVSPRTITNWRREGCPFAEGQPRVLRPAAVIREYLDSSRNSARIACTALFQLRA